MNKIKSKKILTEDFVIDKLGVVFFILFLVHYFTDINFYATYVLWSVSGLLGFIYFYVKYPRYRPTLNLFLVIDIFAAIGAIINKNHSVLIFMSFPAEEFLGLLLFHCKKRLNSFVIVIYLFMVYILLFLLLNPKTVVNADFKDYGVVFSKLVQTNTVSIFLLLFCFIVSYHRYIHNKRKPYIFLLISILVSLYCGGKGGILSIAVLLILIFCQNWKNRKLYIFRVLLVAIAGIIVFSKYSYYFSNSFFDDNSRFALWSGYYDCAKSSFVDFVFGADVSSFTFLFEQKNCHNTFINWHYYYGLIPFLLLCFLLIKSIVSSLYRKNLFMFSMLLVFSLRAFTDESSFVYISFLLFATANCLEEKMSTSPKLVRIVKVRRTIIRTISSEVGLS